MITLSFEQLAGMTGGELVNQGAAAQTFTGVSVDSRTIEPGALFFAIRGERFDGHEFIEKAVERGAAGVVSDTRWTGEVTGDAISVKVDDSHEAMLRLAKAYLGTLKAKRVSITGSNGKTTTKEFTYSLLRAVESNVYRSPGNFNNLFGAPLALFAMPTDTRVAVLEAGISVPGEMEKLAGIIRPHIVAMTNISATHLEFLGTVEAVAREKLHLIRAAESGAPLIVNADDPLLMREAREVKKDLVTFGINTMADFMPDAIKCDDSGATLVMIDGHTFRLPIFGQYQVSNLLAAYAIVVTLGYSFKGVDTQSIPLTTAPMRGEVINAGGVTFVADCYNANPDSVRSGLKSFAEHPAKGRRIAILGDMLELGEESGKYHRVIGLELGMQRFDLAVLVGPESRKAYETARKVSRYPDRLRHCESVDDCIAEMKSELKAGDTVYLKGSRGIGLEAVLKVWQDKEEKA